MDVGKTIAWSPLRLDAAVERTTFAGRYRGDELQERAPVKHKGICVGSMRAYVGAFSVRGRYVKPRHRRVVFHAGNPAVIGNPLDR